MNPPAPTIGTLLLDAGKISPTDAESILRLQKEQGLLFGDAAKALGLITEEDIRLALAKQFDFPFLSSQDSGFSTDLVAAYQPFGKQAETLRAIRSQLMLRWFANGGKVLVVAGCDRGEGRSFLAANLAVVFSQLGERTLLVDADLRAPRQHDLFNIGKKHGLSDVLAGRTDISAVEKIPVFNDLSVLTAGTLAPNPLELISRGIDACLCQLAEAYDVILVDAPAASHGSDVQLLAAQAGGALMVARQHQTRLNRLEQLKSLLEGGGVVCLGVVINDFDSAKGQTV